MKTNPSRLNENREHLAFKIEREKKNVNNSRINKEYIPKIKRLRTSLCFNNLTHKEIHKRFEGTSGALSHVRFQFQFCLQNIDVLNHTTYHFFCCRTLKNHNRYKSVKTEIIYFIYIRTNVSIIVVIITAFVSTVVSSGVLPVSQTKFNIQTFQMSKFKFICSPVSFIIWY